MCIKIEELENTLINTFICHEPDMQYSTPINRWVTIIEFKSKKDNLCLQIKPYFYSNAIAAQCAENIVVFLLHLIKQKKLKSIRNIDPIFTEIEDYFYSNYSNDLDSLFIGYL